MHQLQAERVLAVLKTRLLRGALKSAGDGLFQVRLSTVPALNMAAKFARMAAAFILHIIPKP
jgi:hypothetical protein